jgi:hypothetical protein
MLTAQEAQEIYNKLQVNEVSGPWYRLDKNIQEYYRWLYSKPEYSDLKEK